MLAIEPTPTAARRIVALRKIYPNIVVDPEIEHLAQLGVADDEILTGMSIPQRDLIQDLMDFDLRATVILPPVKKDIPVSMWLDPIIRVARLRGVDTVALLTPTPDEEIHQYLVQQGFCCRVISETDFPDWEIDRNALCLVPFRKVVSHIVTMTFPRLIVVGDAIETSTTALYPELPTTRDLMNDRSLVPNAGHLPVRALGTILSVSYAMSRIEGQPPA